MVVETATGWFRGVRGRAPQPVAPRGARGADLELDLAALERAGPARHGAPAGHAGAMQALVVLVQVVSAA